jgi:methyl-accepting chemotaxis protein
MKNLKIGLKLTLGFGILIIAIIAVAAVSITALNSINNNIDQLLKVSFTKVVEFGIMSDCVNALAMSYNTISMTKDKARIADEQKKIETNQSDIADAIVLVEPLIVDRSLYDPFLQTRNEYRELLTKLNTYIDEDNTEEIQKYILGEFGEKQTEYLARVNAIFDYNLNDMQAFGGEIAKLVNKDVWTLYAVVLISLLLAVIFAVIITNMITRPIGECVDVANSLAKGNTSVEIEVKSKDETGILAGSMQNMVRSIKAMYEDVIYLASEAVAGHLKTRADINKHAGDYAKIIKGLNETLDAVVNLNNFNFKYLKIGIRKF